MKSVRWKAQQMPTVFWSVPVDGWVRNPIITEGLSMEVVLPNNQTVLVENIRYQGINGAHHHWQGTLSMAGTASAQHTVFNCIACGTNECLLVGHD